MGTGGLLIRCGDVARAAPTQAAAGQDGSERIGLENCGGDTIPAGTCPEPAMRGEPGMICGTVARAPGGCA